MENQDLIRRIQILEKWKQDRTIQQISYPLDIQSINILNNLYLRILSTVSYPAGVGSNTFTFYILGQGGTSIPIEPLDITSYTVNVSTDFLNSTGNLKFFDTQPVVLYTDGTAPAPLSAGLGTTYYVRDSIDGHTFKLAATSGGTAINITTAGSGRQFINYD